MNMPILGTTEEEYENSNTCAQLKKILKLQYYLNQLQSNPDSHLKSLMPGYNIEPCKSETCHVQYQNGEWRRKKGCVGE